MAPIHHAPTAAKPCTFKGRFDSKNKRKTGIWRRGLNSDYECTPQELEPILLAKSGLGFEQVVLPDTEWDDLDPSAIALYRQLRARVRPQAEELQASDEDMLYARNLVKHNDGRLRPNVAGLLLLGKPLALRRLLPAVRVDYVRIQGTQWVEDPEQRFATTQDFREPLIRLIPRLEATILDDMPRHFRLREGETQRSDQPLLPQKVVREAVVNALMHRDYRVNQPTLVVRYSNRLEIRNAGYSLKPEPMLGEMGSQLRNPLVAAVLYDLAYAETKGTGIRTMRRLLVKGGAGPSTYYQLAVLPELPLFQAGTGDPVQDAGEPMINADDLATDASDLATNTGDLPEGLRRALDTLTPKARQERLWPVIVWLCAIRPHSAEQLGRLLDRQATHLKVKHLKPLRIEAGYLQYTHPEVINHPEQAYQTTAAGRAWLARQGIAP